LITLLQNFFNCDVMVPMPYLNKLCVFVSVVIVFLLEVAGKVDAANFNIAPGDVAGLKDAINQANINGEADVINLAPMM